MLNKYGNMNCTMVYTSLCGHAMQPWYSIEITRDGSSKTVAFLTLNTPVYVDPANEGHGFATAVSGDLYRIPGLHSMPTQ